MTACVVYNTVHDIIFRVECIKLKVLNAKHQRTETDPFTSDRRRQTVALPRDSNSNVLTAEESADGRGRQPFSEGDLYRPEREPWTPQKVESS